jgi:hypothetical protein
MRGEGIRKEAVLGITVVIIFLMSVGCAPKVKIRAPEDYFTKNLSKKIAILSEGKVNWPRTQEAGNVLVLPHCKESAEESLSATEEVLADKGYEVVYAEVVGVGFYSKGFYFMEDTESNLSQITDSKPLFLYTQFRDDTEFNKSVMHVIGQLELALHGVGLHGFMPFKEDIEVIQQFTGADTICLHRVYGNKYSNRRKVGLAALQILAAVPAFLFPGAPVVADVPIPSDTVEEIYVFVDARTGEVLWQGEVSTEGNPLNPKKYVESVLNYLPTVNEPFDLRACHKAENGYYFCK